MDALLVIFTAVLALVVAWLLSKLLFARPAAAARPSSEKGHGLIEERAEVQADAVRKTAKYEEGNEMEEPNKADETKEEQEQEQEAKGVDEEEEVEEADKTKEAERNNAKEVIQQEERGQKQVQQQKEEEQKEDHEPKQEEEEEEEKKEKEEEEEHELKQKQDEEEGEEPEQEQEQEKGEEKEATEEKKEKAEQREEETREEVVVNAISLQSVPTAVEERLDFEVVIPLQLPPQANNELERALVDIKPIVTNNRLDNSVLRAKASLSAGRNRRKHTVNPVKNVAELHIGDAKAAAPQENLFKELKKATKRVLIQEPGDSNSYTPLTSPQPERRRGSRIEVAPKYAEVITTEITPTTSSGDSPSGESATAPSVEATIATRKHRPRTISRSRSEFSLQSILEAKHAEDKVATDESSADTVDEEKANTVLSPRRTESTPDASSPTTVGSIAKPSPARSPGQQHRRSQSMVFFNNVTTNRTACPSCGKPYLPVRMETECSRCGAPLHVSANAPPESAARKWARLTDPGREPPVARQLIRVKGRRKLSVRLVELSSKSLNSGDSFILDAHTKIFLWNGKSANPMEKAKATDCALRMKNKDKKGKAEIVVIEEGKPNNEDDEDEFWSLLGGKISVLSSEEAGEDDAIEYKDTLYSVIVEETGGVTVSPLIYPRLLKEMLESDHCFVFDCHSELYVWHGASSALIERKRSMSYAEDLLQRSDIHRPEWFSIKTIREGEEPVLLMEKFYNGGNLPISVAPPVSLPTQKPPPKPFDLSTMFATPPSKEKPPVDNGRGKIQMWKVTHTDKEEISESEHGHFYSEESYVFLYTYIPKNRDEYLIYFWQGQDSPITEKGASAVLTIHLHASIGGMAPQIRVVQNREPRHFLLMFPRFVIHKGSRGKPRDDALSLYHVRSNNLGTKAIEIAPDALYLDTMDSFVINQRNDAPIVWIGANCSSEVKQYSLSVASFLAAENEAIVVNEQEEGNVDWIWKAEHSYKIKSRVGEPPRLFQCSLASGFFTADQIVDFVQEDLIDDDCFLLDCADEVYVWIGKTATEDEKKRTVQITMDYLKGKLNRSIDDTATLPRCLIIPSSNEPIQFTRHFHAWKHQTIPSSDLSQFTSVEDRLKEYTRTYTLKELWTRPPGLDYTSLEKYLSDTDFEDLFHCKKEEFDKMTEWKRTSLKKKWKLF